MERVGGTSCTQKLGKTEDVELLAPSGVHVPVY